MSETTVIIAATAIAIPSTASRVLSATKRCGDLKASNLKLREKSTNDTPKMPGAGLEPA